jgi:hypothetical protein
MFFTPIWCYDNDLKDNIVSTNVYMEVHDYVGKESDMNTVMFAKKLNVFLPMWNYAYVEKDNISGNIMYVKIKLIWSVKMVP